MSLISFWILDLFDEFCGNWFIGYLTALKISFKKIIFEKRRQLNCLVDVSTFTAFRVQKLYLICTSTIELTILCYQTSPNCNFKMALCFFCVCFPLVYSSVVLQNGNMCFCLVHVTQSLFFCFCLSVIYGICQHVGLVVTAYLHCLMYCKMHHIFSGDFLKTIYS